MPSVIGGIYTAATPRRHPSSARTTVFERIVLQSGLRPHNVKRHKGRHILGVSPYNPRLIKRLRITYCLKAIDLFIPLHPFLQVIILCTYSVQHIIVGEGTEHSISANQCYVPIDRLVQHSVFGMMTYRESHCIVHLCFLQGKCKHLSAKGCDISRPKTRAKLFNSFLLQTVVLVSCQYGLL